ncbi:hypothetical protein [Endozoicomonas sp. SESOKO1]|uniref:hypothetical protein n=1 Tax=Endozoicomonas sp. SESOKO1 TaxID=2828742 RepID=UPI002147AEAF|nr:hypothetical protein [Endozoicomonas sp. SESOKO1]
MQSSAQPDEGPAFTFGSANGLDSSFFQGVELGARLVAPYTVLPAEISTLLEGFITLSAATRLRDLFGGSGSTTASAPRQSRADSKVDGTPTHDKGKKQETPQQTSPPATASARTGPLPKAALALGVLSGLTAAGAAPASGSKTERWIDVPDAKTLGKIGHDPNLPPNGNYFQTADVDGGRLRRSIGSKDNPFTGKYDGKGRTIYGLDRCLVKNLEGDVDRLRFTDAKIWTSREQASTGVVACKMSGDAVISNIHVESSSVDTRGVYASAGIVVGEIKKGTVSNTTAVNCKVQTSGSHAYSGIGAGYVSPGTVNGTTAVNCEVIASSNAGIGAGYVEHGSVVDTSATHCTVKTSYGGNAAIGAGRVYEGSVVDTSATHCTVESSGSYGNAGIGAGIGGTVTGTKALNCTVESSGSYANAGIGGGRGTNAADTTAINCTVKASGEEGNAGIGGGYGSADNTLAMNCKVENSGFKGNAGIGVGYGIAADTTAINCTVENSGNGGKAGIGVGFGAAANTIAVNCTVGSSGNSSFAGIGAGQIHHHGTDGTVANTRSFNSKVKTPGVSSYAGIGIGQGFGNVVNTRAIKSTVESSQTRFVNNIGGGLNAILCDVRVNGGLQPDSTRDCRYLPDHFCEDIDSRLVKPNCQPGDCYSWALTSDAVTGFESCPVVPETISTTARQITTSGQTIPPEEITTPEVITTSAPPPTSIPTPPTVVPVTPAPMTTTSNATMNFTGLPGTFLALPTTAASLAPSLSAGVIAGFTLGAAVLTGVAGVCVYRHCYRRLSPAAASDPQEFVNFNAVGHEQETGDQPMDRSLQARWKRGACRDTTLQKTSL